MSVKISVLTATRNAAHLIETLYESLRCQTYADFQWVVCDGLSQDETVKHLRKFSERSPWLTYISAPDAGIYDAINKAISLAEGQYYVVAGADDYFEHDALQRYADIAANTGADVLFARVIKAGNSIGGFYPRRAWIGPSKVFVSPHSIGTLFRRDLHRNFGKYSNRLHLLADVYFLKLLLRTNSVRFINADFIAGTFREGGATSSNQLQLLAENWQIQMLTERHPLFQTILFACKIIYRYPKLRRELRCRYARPPSQER